MFPPSGWSTSPRTALLPSLSLSLRTLLRRLFDVVCMGRHCVEKQVPKLSLSHTVKDMEVHSLDSWEKRFLVCQSARERRTESPGRAKEQRD